MPEGEESDTELKKKKKDALLNETEEGESDELVS